MLSDVELKRINISDYDLLKSYYMLRHPMTADNNILALYLWKDTYDTSYYYDDKGLYWVAKDSKGKYYSAIPLCRKEDLKECFLETQNYFNQVLDKKLVMYLVDKEAVDELNLPEDKYVIVPDRTYADYMYDARLLRTFPGKNYHKKKNNLNYFKKNYEGRFEFKLLTKEDKDSIIDYLRRWASFKEGTPEYEMIEDELNGISFVIDHMDSMEFKMAGVLVDGKLAAFTIGNYYGADKLVYINVEKADPSIRGLYQYICSEFLIQAFPDAELVNREDDMGLEGLRKSKMSYHPIKLVEKYTIMQK